MTSHSSLSESTTTSSVQRSETTRTTTTPSPSSLPLIVNKDKLIIIISGPTGVGKSDVAELLCRHLEKERLEQQKEQNDEEKKLPHGGAMIISADSVQAYKGVMIGANKPSWEKRRDVPHLLVDIADPHDVYNVAEWTRDALTCINRLLVKPNPFLDIGIKENVEAERLYLQRLDESIRTARTQMGLSDEHCVTPLVVGGTMMYLQWLLDGRPDAMRPTSRAIQRAQEDIERQVNWNDAVQHVASFHPLFAHRVSQLGLHDWYRLRRTLEIAYTISEMEEQAKQQQQQEETTDNKNDTTKQEEEERNDNNDATQEKQDDSENEDEFHHVSEMTNIEKITISNDALLESLFTGEREGGLASMMNDEKNNYDVRCFFLCPDHRMKHCELTDRRCEQMLMRGLLRETADLECRGELPDRAVKAIGYRQVLDYLYRPEPFFGDEMSLEGFIDDFCTATRRYAKKQMSWFRKQSNYMFVSVPMKNDNSAERAQTAFSEIVKYCAMPREEYEDYLLTRQWPSGEIPPSQQVRTLNRKQGSGMKHFQTKRLDLNPGTEAFEALLKEADECLERIQELQQREEYAQEKERREKEL